MSSDNETWHDNYLSFFYTLFSSFLGQEKILFEEEAFLTAVVKDRTFHTYKSAKTPSLN